MYNVLQYVEKHIPSAHPKASSSYFKSKIFALQIKRMR